MIIANLVIKENKLIKEEYFLSSFSIFTRKSIKEFIRLISLELNKDCTPKLTEYTHTFDSTNYYFYTKKSNDLTVILTIKNEDTSLSEIINKINLELKNFDDKNLELDEVNKELEETKTILKMTLESVLQRGEKLDKLVEQSEELSIQSKALFKAAKKQNRCCKF
ncbi:synaptobrevin VAMP [Tubulinosema ratisbonensis]|uniref:Synaptobrevin VAMP n=1 Tax=Tubulinosema ratisbonensis TaxID=291195 RepID=A0A437ANH8_9MICR|nr:synaptobrevin VAMP [Tubulinosema ratisbonensis]